MRTLSFESKPEHEHPATHTMDNFLNIMKAAQQGRISLVPGMLKTTGERAAAVCGINKVMYGGEKAFHLVPLAVMFNEAGRDLMTPDADVGIQLAPDGGWIMLLTALAEQAGKNEGAVVADSKGNLYSKKDVETVIAGEPADVEDVEANPLPPKDDIRAKYNNMRDAIMSVAVYCMEADKRGATPEEKGVLLTIGRMIGAKLGLPFVQE